MNERKVQNGKYHIPNGPISHKYETLSQVEEEHVYVTYKLSNGKDLLLEVDLLGDKTKDEGYGELPPVIHIECPVCTTEQDRSLLSITYPNKTFTLEPLKPPYQYFNVGGQRVESKYLLTINEPFMCTFCGTRFKLSGNTLQNA